MCVGTRKWAAMCLVLAEGSAGKSMNWLRVAFSCDRVYDAFLVYSPVPLPSELLLLGAPGPYQPHSGDGDCANKPSAHLSSRKVWLSWAILRSWLSTL